MFSLEKHLDNTCVQNPDFEILNSIWKLNKKQLPLAQNAISFNFPHYSLHEKSHSDTIIKNIESFLGEERIRKLSATDTWMLLMSAYTHDLGMVVFHSALEKDWIGVPFQNYLEELSSESVDGDLKNAAQLLVEIEHNKTPSKVEGIKLPLAIRQAVILITADFFRKKHHIRSQEIIKGKDSKFHELLNGFNLTSIPNRFSNVLADVCFSHGTDFYSILESLEYQSNGFGNDKMHPRFLAFMLRLGDLLDIDDKRFNMFDEQVLGIALPHVSSVHKEKHASTKHLLITPESIEATVDCQTDEVYRIAREWFDWLQQEVEKQNSEWASIAPKNLNGMPPTISKNKLKVLYKSSEPKKELMNLRFTISNKKVFEMFEGSAIYEKAEFVFIRELIQNALDASKIQIWKYIQQGIYDPLLRKFKSLPNNSSHEDIIQSIKFPTDIPDDILEDFPVDLNISWENNKEKILKIEVTDKGTGISEKDLIRLTTKVGESHSGDTEYLKFRESMPYWLQPTGAFGIGLQSIFLLTPSFTVQTKTDNEQGYEIIFQSAKKGEYSKISKENIKVPRGTKVMILLPKERFTEVFNSSFSFDVIEEYDHFTDHFGDIYIHKIKRYILNELSNVKFLNATLFNSKILPIESSHNNLKTDIGLIQTSDIQCTVFKEHDGSNIVLVNENVIGSAISLKFINSFNKNPLSEMHFRDSAASNYYVRDIPVDEKISSFYKTSYCRIRWNLQSPKSDKILNISRDKLIANTKYKINNEFLEKILPQAVSNSITIFESHYGKVANTSHEIAIEYFHMELTASLLGQQLVNNTLIYQSYYLPDTLVTTFDFKPILCIDFFKAKEFYFINKTASVPEDQNQIKLKDEWIKFQTIQKFNSGYVIWDKEYFSSYFLLTKLRLNLINVIKDSSGITQVQRLDKSSNLNLQIETNSEALDEIFSSNNVNMFSNRRNIMIPITPFEEVLAVNDVDYDGFSSIPPHNNRGIISPFINNKKLTELAFQCEKEISSKDLDALKKKISLIASNYLPDKLLNWVLEHNSNSQKAITIDLIRENYISLMVDMVSRYDFLD